jgi:hypothetical protein
MMILPIFAAILVAQRVDPNAAPGLDPTRAADMLQTVQNGLMWGLGGLMGLSLLFLGICLVRGDRPGLNRNWGGFGNGGSGWQLTPSLTFLIMSVIFGALFAASGMFGIRSISELTLKKRNDQPSTLPAGGISGAGATGATDSTSGTQTGATGGTSASKTTQAKTTP